MGTHASARVGPATVALSDRCPDCEKKDHHLGFSFSKKKMLIKSQILKEKAKGE